MKALKVVTSHGMLKYYYQVPNKRTGVRSMIFENLSWSTPYWGHCTQ